MFREYIDEKISRGEETFTKQEIISTIERIISTSYNTNNKRVLRIKSCLTKYLPASIKLESAEADERTKYLTNSITFNLSVFRPPKQSIFLSSLYGLYSHEQAVRPLLSLTYCPDNLKDIWSVTRQDLMLWNPCCIEPCRCPPMFGYSIPPSFFGKILDLNYECSNKGIHLARYTETSKGNECMLLDSRPDYSLDIKSIADDCEEEVKVDVNLEFYLEQLKAIVTNVCDLISDNDKDPVEDSISTLMDSCTIYEDYSEKLWDTDPSESEVTCDQILEDDNCHPLLEARESVLDEVSGVSPEIKEMIRKCLSPESKMNGDEAPKIDAETLIGMCDPPCSVWCHAGPKLERSDSVLSSSSASAAISLLRDTTDFLLNACNAGISSKKITDSKLDFPLGKRNFKRSFSANDCDLSYDERCRLDYQIPRFSTSSREDLEFLRRDPINFFKTRGDRNDSYQDNDSGIDSFWSSQEDFYDTNPESKDGYCDLGDIAPMWSLFTGEDSLWKPLPDCAPPDHTKFMHKRDASGHWVEENLKCTRVEFVSVAFLGFKRKSIPVYC
ncbi:uncharacterized protein TNCT_134271 [Trichonephila clavata]|uniref:Uncharacterized protein n=1 Tax=Trichonephila clavata TaxID=2740835 RepID=A0A8X6LWN4_TRICU|nr:uncharacterized protein TNCT_134271 [Trichonephila clavata]